MRLMCSGCVQLARDSGGPLAQNKPSVDMLTPVESFKDLGRVILIGDGAVGLGLGDGVCNGRKWLRKPTAGAISACL